MRPLHSFNEWPKIAVYDLEAGDWVNICLVCHLDEYGNRITFNTVPDYLDWLFSEFQGDIVFAHAGGHYDHRFLIAEMHKRKWDFRTAISGNTIVILTATNGKKTIKFGDSYRLMPDSLQKIGDTVKLPKLDVNPSEIEKLSPQEVLDYCYRDCEIVLKGLQLMRVKLSSAGADFAFTLASIAARYNRRNPAIRWDEFVVKEGRKTVPHPNIKRWDKGCYEAYHGGWCEMHERTTYEDSTGAYDRIIRDPTWCADIVSSYPRAMLEPLPLYFKGYFTPQRNLKDPRTFLSHCGITDCDVFIPDCHLSCLPVKDENGRLTFPKGPQSGSWTNIELIEALNQGAEILHIRGQYRFEAVPFMRTFVLRFYKLRQQAKDDGDDFASYAYKILLNSSYGKLVETIERKSYITIGEKAAAIKQGAKVEMTPTQGLYVAISEEVGPFRHTAAGAYVTAIARLRLFSKMIEMHNLGARILYCDTDSLMCNMPIVGAKPAKTGQLGDWEEVDRFSELELVLPKVYRAVSATGKKTIYKCKGCPIERKWEDAEMPQKRWEAFKNYRFNETEEAAAILGKPGITGFKSDIKAGNLMPRKLQKSCKTCKASGKLKGLECPTCNGKGSSYAPLVRSLRSQDKKREWNGFYSAPLTGKQK